MSMPFCAEKNPKTQPSRSSKKRFHDRTQGARASRFERTPVARDRNAFDR